MTKVRRFEELHCWQKARILANTILGLTRHPEFSKDFRLRDQILDAAGQSCITSLKDVTRELILSLTVF
jgi:hypothetical protein